MDDKEQKVIAVTDTIKNDEQKEQVDNPHEEALWIRSSRFQRGGRYRRYQSNNRGGNNARGQIRGARGGYRSPHNRCYTCNSDKHYAAHCDASEGQFTDFVSQAETEISQ